MKVDFTNYRFHCSSLGAIMTDSRTKDPLGETCKAHLLECYIEAKYDRHQEMTNKYVEKGNMVEESSITLYSRCTKIFYKKNREVFENEFIIGTPDIITDTSVKDIKSSWSIWTFFENMQKPINKGYKFQVNGYMDLLGKNTGSLVYVLENTPDVLIEQEKSKLRYKMGIIDPDASELYQQACIEIDKNCIFDDIPLSERYIEFDVPKIDMGEVYERVKLCREFLNKLP